MPLYDDDVLHRNLCKAFKLNHFTDRTQKDAIKAILKQDRDVLVSMPSGSRKSLCFHLPGVMLVNKIAVVVSPTTSSIKRRMHDLNKWKIKVTSFTSMLSEDELKRISKDMTSKKPKNRFLYVTPEVASTDDFGTILESLNKKEKLAFFAVDDAHCISQRAQDFRHEYMKLGSLRKAYPSVPWIALTHNASADVLNDVVVNLQLRKRIAKFSKSSFRKNLHRDIIYKNTILDLFPHLKQYVMSCLENGDDNVKKNKKPCGIVYCKNRETVKLVTKKLTDEGIATKAYHGGMKTKDRQRVQDDWIAGVFPVIVATTSFGAGIDKSSVRFVVHWDVPPSVVSYFKNSGMAGRDGKASYCRIYYCRADVMAMDSDLKSDINTSKDENGRRKALRAHADFLKMSGLCETVICRHKIISDYFEDVAPKCDGKCDVCADPQQTNVALDIFHRLSDAPNRNIDTPISTDQPNFENLSTDFSTVQLIKDIRPPGSPALTIIKEECPNDYAAASDELFGMQRQPRGNVSPAKTLIKEELDESIIEIDQGFVNDFGDLSALGSNSMVGIGLFMSPRSVSSAETEVEEKPVVNSPSSDHSVRSPDSPNSVRSVRRQMSPLSSLNPPNFYPATLTDPITPRIENGIRSGNESPGISSYVTVIEQEASRKQSSDGNPRNSHRESRSLSPTETIVKEECMGPERNTELESCYDEDLFDVSPGHGGSVGTSEMIIENRNELHSEIIRELDDQLSRLSAAAKILLTDSKPSAVVDSTDYRAVESLNLVVEIDESTETGRSHSVSIRHPIIDDPMSSPRPRKKTEDCGKRRRSRSSERLKRVKRLDSHKSFRSEKRGPPSHESDSERERKSKHSRKCDSEVRGSWRRYLSESKAKVGDEPGNSNDRHRRTQPSTSTKFESPDENKFGTNNEEDAKPVYGWEDPPPTKLKSDDHSTQEDLDPIVQKKMQEFNDKVQTTYDLDVIDASKKALYQAIEESIAKKTEKKLTELDVRIRKKQDEYARQLFGTDNFDSWDDDPALSNVECTEQLKPFKSLVPDDVPLLDKMSMKHVINAKNIISDVRDDRHRAHH